MPTLLEELQKIQPCDGRGLIQILSQQIVRELIAAKKYACDEVANTLTNYGIENVYPCDYLTEQFLKRLQEGDPITAFSEILVKAGYPPHLLKIFIDGFDKLTDQELQQVIEWTTPITGIQVHRNTARYLRTSVTNQQQISLQTYIETVVSTIEVPFVREEEEFVPLISTQSKEIEREKERSSRLEELPLRAREIITGTGPKVTEKEWTGEAFDSTTQQMIVEYISEGLIDSDVYSNLQLLNKPTNEGGFGVTSGIWGITRTGDIQLQEVVVTGQRTIPQVNEPTTTTIETTSIVEKTETTVTETVTIEGPLTLEEVQQVEKFYLDQGIKAILRPFATTLKTKIFDKIKCPAPDRLAKLITRIKNLGKIINKLKTTITKISEILNLASATINLISIIIDKLKKVLAANDAAVVAATVSLIGIPLTGPIVQASRLIDKLIAKYEPRIDALDKALCAAAKSVAFVVANLNVVDAFIQVIDGLLRNCVEKGTDLGLSTFNPAYYTPAGETYRGYRLEIRTRQSDNAVKQRYAVAIDSYNVAAIQGPYSFSADADILLEELRYRIDTYLG